MDSKLTQKGWMSVAIWLGLFAGTAYTSNSTINVFGALYQNLLSVLQTGIGDLFSNYGVLFATVLAIVLIFLLVSAWLGFVSYSFEVGNLVFGDDDEDDDDTDFLTLPGQVARYLGFSWGLFYILMLIFPMVMR